MSKENDAPSPTWTPETTTPGPSWEKIARPGFAGSALSYDLRIRFNRDVDWSRVESALEAVYHATGQGYRAHGRQITFTPRQLTLSVSGTSRDRPGDDDKLQTRLIVLVLAQLQQHLDNVGTERWTDTPFEEPPEKTRGRSEGIAFLEMLVVNTFAIQIVELDYYTSKLRGGDAANPEIRISIDGPVERSLGARPNWIPATAYVPPGRYRLTAAAPAFGLPEYRGTLKDFSREPIFVSHPLIVNGSAGDTIELRVGVPEDKRRLPPAHKAFYDQWNAADKQPPPPPLEEIFIEIANHARPSDS